MLCFSLFDTPRDFVHVDSFGEVVQMIEGRFTFAKKERRKYKTVLIDKEDPLCRSGWAETYKVTADHGCDPADDSTDHTREYVPFLMCGKNIPPENLGTVHGFDHVARTVCRLLNVK